MSVQPHLDGPLYYPTIATVNLGSHTVLNYYSMTDRNQQAFSIYLQPRSLLVQQNDMYTSFLHGIEGKESDILDQSTINVSNESDIALPLKRGIRVSLTIRHVLKTTKMKTSGFALISQTVVS